MTITPLFHFQSESPGPAAWMARWLLPFALGIVLTGCLSRPALVQQTFALQATRPVGTVAPKADAVLAVRVVEVSPLFEGRDFVYRTGADLYQVDPYAGFLVSPSHTLAIALRNGLRETGAFKDVVEPESQLGADIALEAHVTELYGDFRKPGPPAAVLSLRMLIFETGSGKTRQPLLEKEYSRRVPLPQKTAVALAAGWDGALASVLAEVASDFAAAQAVRPAPR
jgi:cholesterol transport system auxiliary component